MTDTTPARVALTDDERLALMDAALEEMPNRALTGAIERILADRLAAREAAVRAQIKADLIASVLAPQWRTNRGHEFDGTAEAYAAGRNDVIDLLRARIAGGEQA